MKTLKKQKKKINILKLLITIILLILIILFISKKFNKTENIDTSNTQNTSISAENTDVPSTPEISEVQKANEQRKACSEISTTRKLPILMYHFFYDAEAGETGRDGNFVEIHTFEQQIKYLADNNYYVPSWQEVRDFVDGKIGLPEKSVIITVDDGDESFFKLAVPVLEKYNFYATSFVITSWYGHQVANYPSEVIDYQSHSDNMHIAGSNGKGAFLTLSVEDATKDLNASRSILGNNCEVFCYPFGHFDDNVIKILKDCNFTIAVTTVHGRVSPGMDIYKLPRIRIDKSDTLNSFISKVQ